jgi:hypothetical protein
VKISSLIEGHISISFGNLMYIGAPWWWLEIMHEGQRDQSDKLYLWLTLGKKGVKMGRLNLYAHLASMDLSRGWACSEFVSKNRVSIPDYYELHPLFGE